jgi:glycosyltransferase involved in cell wall biosynthesis
MPVKNLLFFTSFNERSVHMESMVLYFAQHGYKVYFLTTCEKGPIHEELEKKNIACDTLRKTAAGLFYYFGAARALSKFCKKNNIDVIHSHLQIPNLVSCIVGIFSSVIVFNVRHNSDVIEISGTRKEKIAEKIINRLSKHIIAISDKVKQQLVNKEHVNPKKIHRINNGYNFENYNSLSVGENTYQEIRAKYPCDFLLLSPGRLVTTKRHDSSIKGIKQLKEKGFNVKLLIIGEGPEKNNLTQLILSLGLENEVYLAGYQENIADYIKACNAVVLLSESEASNNTAKEAGYFEKPVIVCEGVGDFSDYIVHGQTGYLVPKHSPADFVKIVEECVVNPDPMVGKHLKQIVLDKFSIKKVGLQYEELQSSLKN